jgi:hypothetical protein
VSLVAVGVGCSSSPRAEDYVPTEDAARTALESYLQSWTRGETGSPVPNTNPAVEVADGLRLKGHTLLKYEILGPIPGDADRCFAVKLSLGNPALELRERYVVLGLDPIWVWRYDDYVMITHWDHGMPAEKSGPSQKR